MASVRRVITVAWLLGLTGFPAGCSGNSSASTATSGVANSGANGSSSGGAAGNSSLSGQGNAGSGTSSGGAGSGGTSSGAAGMASGITTSGSSGVSGGGVSGNATGTLSGSTSGGATGASGSVDDAGSQGAVTGREGGTVGEGGGACSPDLGFAMEFQSQTPDLLLATIANLPTGTQARTVELWAYFDGTANSWLNEHGLFETGDRYANPLGGCHEFAVNSTFLNGQIAELHPYGNCDAVDNFFVVPTGALTNDKGWLHVSFAYDDVSKNFQFTINGDGMLMTGLPANRTHPESNWPPGSWGTTSYTAADATMTGLTNNPGGNLLSIGSTIQFGGPAGWGGRIDEFRVWNVFRDAATIKANMYTLMKGSQPGLVAYYKFDEGTGMTAADSTGNHGNDAKMTKWNGSLTPPKWVKSDIPGTFACNP